MPSQKKQPAEEVIGHAAQLVRLVGNARRGELGQALLFTGPQNLGKALVAQVVARTVVCQAASLRPCGQCPACRQTAAGCHPDVHRLEPAADQAQIGIEAARELISSLQLKSWSGRKVVVVEQAELLTVEAANALLKTIEEPAGETTIILVAPSRQSVPVTVASRCQESKFFPVSTATIRDGLRQYGVPAKRAAAVAALAYNRPGVAFRLLVAEGFADLLDQAKKIFTISQAPIDQRLLALPQWLQVDRRGDEVRRRWRELFRDLLLVRSGNAALATHQSLLGDLQAAAQRYRLVELQQLLDRLTKLDQYLAAQVNPRLAWENFVLSY